ncbi:hypothetical protein [Spirosoma koreense]
MRKVYKSVGIYFLAGLSLAVLLSLWVNTSQYIASDEVTDSTSKDDSLRRALRALEEGTGQIATIPGDSSGFHDDPPEHPIKEKAPVNDAPSTEADWNTEVDVSDFIEEKSQYQREKEAHAKLSRELEAEMSGYRKALTVGRGEASVSLQQKLFATKSRIHSLQLRLDSLYVVYSAHGNQATDGHLSTNSPLEGQPASSPASDPSAELTALIHKLFPASIAFSTPKLMYVGEPQPITLIIDPNRTPAQAKQELAKTLIPRIDQAKTAHTLTADSIRISDIVDAHLSGSDFVINQISRETQVIKKDGPTEWSWEVIPQTEDAQWLHLVINTQLYYKGGNQNYALQTYHRNIKVDVTMGARISRFIEKYSGTLPFIFGTASIFGFWGWFVAWIRNWLDSRKKLDEIKPARTRQRRSTKRTPPTANDQS